MDEQLSSASHKHENLNSDCNWPVIIKEANFRMYIILWIANQVDQIKWVLDEINIATEINYHKSLFNFSHLRRLRNMGHQVSLELEWGGRQEEGAKNSKVD